MLEDSFIFFPTKYPDGEWRPRGLSFENAFFSVPGGPRLHGWYVAHKAPRAIVLFAHGNGGNLSHRADLLRVLHDDLSLSTLAFDYRGYGRSEGKPSEQGVLEDGRAAAAWLAERTGVRPTELVLYGESLGGAVVVDLAAAKGARALVLENTFSNLTEMAAHHYPWFPTKSLIGSRFDSTAKIKGYRGPLLQVHGDADTIIPIELGRRLFAAANEPKEFVTIRGADHNDPRRPEFYAALDLFLSRLDVNARALGTTPVSGANLS